MSDSHRIREQSIAQKLKIQESNPCHLEQMRSLKCVETNGIDSEQCKKEIENAKICRTFWYSITTFRRRNAIFPHLPDSQQRLVIKQKFMKTGNTDEIIKDMKREFHL